MRSSALCSQTLCLVCPTSRPTYSRRRWPQCVVFVQCRRACVHRRTGTGNGKGPWTQPALPFALKYGAQRTASPRVFPTSLTLLTTHHLNLTSPRNNSLSSTNTPQS
ncbi:hypothetical protein BDZ91DRAFT_744151 [Kalaharituber pfeilii]|nr:hypothetical protein BDZ91DRAFT_744151 [Kalaharituber pfeilii]